MRRLPIWLAGIFAILLLSHAAEALTPAQEIILFSGQHYALDRLPKAAAAYSLRRLLTSYRGNALNVRRASDNATQNIGFVGQNLNVVQAAEFAGTDATASCSTTGSSTTLACTGASSAPNANDPISGAGIIQPAYIVSCGVFVAGAGSCTMNAAQNIALAETVTFQAALFVTKWYDQSGNVNDVVQATAAQQPQLLPNGGASFNNLPVLSFIASSSQWIGISTNPALMQPFTMNGIAQRTGDFSNVRAFLNNAGAATPQVYWNSAPNTMTYQGSTPAVNFTASDAVAHAISVAFNGASSFAVVDRTTTSGSTASNSLAGWRIGTATTPVYMTANVGEAILANWNASQIAALHTNQKAYWGTP